MEQERCACEDFRASLERDIDVERKIAVIVRATGRADVAEIMQPAIHQMRCNDVAKRIEDRLDASGKLLLPRAKHRADLLALQRLLRPAQRAGNQRKLHRVGVAGEIALANIRERSEHIVRPSGMTRLTTLYVSCSTMRKGTPRSLK